MSDDHSAAPQVSGGTATKLGHAARSSFVSKSEKLPNSLKSMEDNPGPDAYVIRGGSLRAAGGEFEHTAFKDGTGHPDAKGKLRGPRKRSVRRPPSGPSPGPGSYDTSVSMSAPKGPPGTMGSSMFKVGVVDRFGRPVETRESGERMPGPGAYDASDFSQPTARKPVAASAFRSGVPKVDGTKALSGNPGPAYYYPDVKPRHESFHWEKTGAWCT